MAQPDQVPFPPDLPNWGLVRDMLTELQERLLNETINAQDAALHIQVIYDASQAIQQLDESWLLGRHEVRGQARSGSRFKLDQSYLWYGMLKFLKKVEREESERFLFTTLPNIIELALRVEEHVAAGGLRYSHQQRGSTTVLSRQFIASILACSFLCLFPERVRDRTSKLNVVNFTNFFKHLPQSSQMAKLRCIVHYFERVIDNGLDVPGNIKFHRQVADRSALPTMEDVVECDIALCPFTFHPEGVIEDVGSSAVQVDFANRSIGGGVLGRGRVQEEIRFSTCPELIVAMVFMENMEENEAIIISGFEQFAQCTGYAASLQYAGPFHDHAQRDPSGNLLNTLCAIDATSFRWGGHRRQYMDSFVMREVNKAYVGFCHMEPDRMWRSWSSVQGTPSERDSDFLTAQESVEEEVNIVPPKITEMADIVSRGLLSHGIVEAARLIVALQACLHRYDNSEDDLHLGEMSLGSTSSDNMPGGQAASTPREDSGHIVQASRDDGNNHSHGGNGERLSLPMIIPRPQNGSCDLLEVDYTEWLANFRRRSSQLSDLTSRRSSSSTKHSSEFSSDLEEIYETLVQAEKAQHGIIEEETYGAALSDYAASFVSSLMQEGTSVAAQMMPDMKDFQQGQLPVGVHRPQVLRPAGVRFGGDNGSSDMVSVAEFEHNAALEEEDQDLSVSDGAAGRLQCISVKALCRIDMYVQNLVEKETRKGLKEAAESISSGGPEPSTQDDSISDDVYVWFADKIVHEVFSQAVDDLYFQRFTSDSRWRAELSVNREGVYRRASYEERKDSLSSSSSCSSGLRESFDSQSKNSSSLSSHSAESDVLAAAQKKAKSITWSNIPPVASGPSEQESDVKDVKSSSQEGRTSEEGGVNQEVERTKTLSPSPIVTFKSIPPSPSESAEIPASPFPTEQVGISHSHPPSVVSETLSSSLLPGAPAQSKELKSDELCAVSDLTSFAAGDSSSSKPVPSSMPTAVLPNTAYTTAQSTNTSLSDPEPAAGSDQTGASSDLNLDCYRAAAEIVNQVFQSLPEHLSKLSEGGRVYRGGLSYYHGRKYDTFVPRSSYEVAAAVIGASEKGNVVTESYMQTKTGAGVLSSGRASPRRTRSQSPCFSWLTNRLSRETVTNAFVKVESRPNVKSYERRSSEPCQRSVNLSLQAFSSSRLSSNRSDDGGHKKMQGDDDLANVRARTWRRGSLDSISLDRRRSSCGFKDPVLSTFAQELMNADTSVPQLFLMSSGSTASTTESRRSSMSGFRDTTLATFESELLNSSFGQTPSSPRHHRPKRSQSRESRLWKSDSSETEYWFPIPRRVGSEFQEEMERLNRHYSVDEIEDYADFIANTILQQAVTILHHDMEEVTQEDEDISIFSENLADQIMREALVGSARLSRQQPRRPPTVQSASGSEFDLSLSSNDLTGRSLEDRLTDFQDALDIPFNRLEAYAVKLAHSILSSVLDEFGATLVRVLPGRRPIATGNWGCGAFHGDPCLKVALQWIAASMAHAPQLIYFTFGDSRLHQIDAVTQMIMRRNWTVGQLMLAVQTYCLTVLSDDS
ncbi:hypothetical protein BaRGS_00028140, partial [Batillaria attramentaria]